MFKNYLLLTFRTLSRQKVSSFIAIAGLALGITSVLLLFAFIDYHRHFDEFIPEDSQIKRLVCRTTDVYGRELVGGLRSVNYYVSEVIRENVPGIGESVRLAVNEGVRIRDGEDIFFEMAYCVDPGFFNLIPFEVVAGSRDLFFSEPDSIVLEETLAEKYFPGGNALGKMVNLIDGQGNPFRVTGIVRVPSNSHLYNARSQVFVPLDFFRNIINKSSDIGFDSPDSPVKLSLYFKPVAGFSESILQKEINGIVNQIPVNENITSMELSFEDFKDIHLYSRENSGDVLNPLYMILFLGLLTSLLLIISIINTVSILTAQSLARTREVGIRLVMGSRRMDLAVQFFSESFILTLFSLIVSLVLLELLLPSFSNLVSVDLAVSYTPAFFLFCLLLVLIVGAAAGAYPVLFLSSLDPVESLKGKKLLKLGKSKKILLVSQFLFASIVLLWSLVFNNEIRRIQNLDPGFDSENLISIFPGWDLDMEPVEKLEGLKGDLKRIPGVEEVSYTGYAPFTGGMGDVNLFTDEEGVSHYEIVTFIDPDYLKAIGVETLEGDSQREGAVIMKSANEYRKLKPGDLIELDSVNYRVSAVIEDYFIDGPYGDMPKFHVISKNGPFYFQLIKLSHNVDIGEIRQVWREYFPDRIFEYHYMDESIEAGIVLPVVRTLERVMNLTVAITLFLSALGLFGLILQTLKQKTKEIGIRKVLGAGFWTVITQVLREILILIASGVSIGIVLGMVSINPLVGSLGYPFPVHNLFLLSLLSALLIVMAGMLFIGTIVFKAAGANPAEALRYE
ncbi:ABC transporter permease [Spirochaeta isovalerica]|uniref:Putative ABC transport system permease protein n=1 Tax=Spirochaeta isovalerica TaxID=150 RepID=A0A841RAG1_9SPIO|nr:ABC transporter permease [Spirochaeta isovalerica]MBB6479668.1 putative ABC transport system permease protein [Spirochaeta isovalerica]